MLKIEFVRLPSGGISILPDREEIEEAARQQELIESQSETPSDHPISALIRQQYEEAIAAANQPPLSIQTFTTPEFRVFTRGEKLEAKRKATKHNAETDSFEVDEELFHDNLLCLCTGLTLDVLRAQENPIYEAISARVSSRVGVSAGRLSFFSSKPTSSLTETLSAETHSSPK